VLVGSQIDFPGSGFGTTVELLTTQARLGHHILESLYIELSIFQIHRDGSPFTSNDPLVYSVAAPGVVV